MQAMRDAADIYRIQLDQAADNLKKVTGEHERLRQAIEKQIEVAKGLTASDLEDLRSASARTGKAADHRDSIQEKHNVTDEALNPTGMSLKELKRMADAANKLELDLEAADKALKKSITAEERLQQAVLSRAKNQTAADERRPTSNFGQAFRKISTGFRKLIGSRGRKALKPLKPFVDRAKKQIDAIRNPAKAKDRRDKARAAHKTAQQEHQAAKDAHAKAPTADTAAAVEKTGKGVATAASEMEAAEGVAAVAEAFGGLIEVLGPVGIAIGLVGAAATAALAAINRQLAAGKKEVERFRSERSRYSGEVANAVARYDYQTRSLEQRSSSATSATATGVVNSTTNLRESVQKRSEDWENISNAMQEMKNVIATGLSDLIQAVDVITPIAKFGVGAVQSGFAMVGVKLTALDENTKQPEKNIGLDAINRLNKSNSKKFPPLPPIK